MTEAQFLRGIKNLRQAPPEPLPWIFVAGRSNAGKSSLLNMLTGRKGLARVSKTPGRTSEANYFLIDRRYLLVDLPGYGYAARARAEQSEWGAFIPPLFADHRAALLLLLADIRRACAVEEEMVLELARRNGVGARIVLTKSDKVGRNDRERSLRGWRRIDPDAIVTSARLKAGTNELRECIERCVKDWNNKE